MQLLRRSRLVLADWPVAAVGVVVIVVVLAIVAGGVRLSAASRSAGADAQAAQLARLAVVVTKLSAAIQDEQDDLAMYVAEGRPKVQDALLVPQGQESVTNLAASRLVSQASRIGSGFAPSVHTALTAATGTARAIISLRDSATQSEEPALALVRSYSLQTSRLIAFYDEVTTATADPVIVGDVRALAALARAEADASQQRSILDAALTAGQFGAGEAQALAMAHSQERADLARFDSSASVAEQRNYSAAMAGQFAAYAAQMLSQALASPQHLAVANPSGSGFPTAALSWHYDMTYTVDQMRGVARGLLTSVEDRSLALHDQASQTIRDTGIEMAVVAVVVAAAVVAVVLLRRRRFFAPLSLGPDHE